MTAFGKTLVGIIILIVIGIGVWVYFTRPVKAPSGDIQSQVGALPETTPAPTQKSVSIVPQESKAEFSLHEELRGKPTLVVGVTGDIAGNISITQNPASVTIGEIKINARTLKTDNDQRNGAIARLILKSEDPANEFIVFKTTGVSGLPSEIVTGAEFPFQITGDLTIKGVTKSVVFDAKGMMGADGTFSGSAQKLIAYKDFGITVPDLPFLAHVDDTVTLAVHIVAK